MESQELSIRNRISEDVARSELGGLSFCVILQDQRFKIAVPEYQRQARDAVIQAVKESSENYEVMMMQEFQGIQHRYEGRMKENERRVAPVIGSEARDALRGQKTICFMNNQFFFTQEKEKNSL